MKKLKVIVTTLCLVVAMALAMPTAALADESSGPQGAAKSSTPPPPPPPKVDWWTIFWALIRVR